MVDVPGPIGTVFLIGRAFLTSMHAPCRAHAVPHLLLPSSPPLILLLYYTIRSIDGSPCGCGQGHRTH
jgi:hypothetical protein